MQEALIAAAAALVGGRHPRAARAAGCCRRRRDGWSTSGAATTARRDREVRVASEPSRTAARPQDDDTLTVLFLCCHPVLTPASAIALTLRAVGGLTTAEIAARLPRPRGDDGAADQPGQAADRGRTLLDAVARRARRPAPQRPARPLPDVQRGLHRQRRRRPARASTCPTRRSASRGSCTRAADDPEVAGLLALMLLTDARRPARTDASGTPVPLADQDRSLWDRARIAEGTALLDGAIGRGRRRRVPAAGGDRGDPRPCAPRADATDWPQILALYGLLERMTGNPVVTLNLAVATAMVRRAGGGPGGPGRRRRHAPPRRPAQGTPARAGGRPRAGPHPLPSRRGPGDERRGTPVPRRAGGAPRVVTGQPSRAFILVRTSRAARSGARRARTSITAASFPTVTR